MTASTQNMEQHGVSVLPLAVVTAQKYMLERDLRSMNLDKVDASLLTS